MTAGSTGLYGRRQMSSSRVHSAEMRTGPYLPPIDLPHAKVLPRSEWLRLKDSLDQEERCRKRQIEAEQQRQAMHLQSKEAVKHWPNTFAGQHEQKLQARKLREEIKEEQRKLIDAEEAKYQEQKRNEAIKRAKTQQFHQTDRVRSFHSALLQTEVLKEREAQIQLKRRKQNESNKQDKEYWEMVARRQEEESQLEKEKALKKKQERLEVAECLKQQMKELEQKKKWEKMKEKKDAEELNQRAKELSLLEQSKLEQRKQEEKACLIRNYQQHVADRKIIQATEAQKLKQEEKHRELVADAKEKEEMLRQEKKETLLRQKQRRKDAVFKNLAEAQSQKQEQELNHMKELIAKKTAREEAEWIQQQREREEKEAAALKSIDAHRKAKLQENERKRREEKRAAADCLTERKKADRNFHETQKLKKQKMKEDAQTLQQLYILQMDEKHKQSMRMKKEVQELRASDAALKAAEEIEFQQYAQHAMASARAGQRNTSLLHRAARQGIGGGLGPVLCGTRPSYQGP